MQQVSQQSFISIHALREEGDDAVIPGAVVVGNFYPRPPRGGRPGKAAVLFGGQVISIHALREEGDTSSCSAALSASEFLSTPSARRATVGNSSLIHPNEFLSTPSARRATGRLLQSGDPCEKISIHALREEGDDAAGTNPPGPRRFLSTPSARRATAVGSTGTSASTRFLSTPSARRATQGVDQQRGAAFISIHALREEGDSKNRDKISIFL